MENLKKYNLKTYPSCVTIDTTYLCNLKCKMCHQSNPEFEIPENPHISLKLIERMMPLLKKSKTVYFLGAGEPLMHPKIYDIVRMVKEKCPNTEIAFTSNGTLLNDKNCEELIKSKLDFIRVSVDGFNLKRGHRGVKQTLKNLRKLNEIKKSLQVETPKIGLGFVAGRDNIDDLIPIMKEGIKFGCNSIVVEPLKKVSINHSWNKYIDKNNIYLNKVYVSKVFEKAKRFGKKNNIDIITPYIENSLSVFRQKCRQPFNFLKVTMDGNVYMCPQGYPHHTNVLHDDPMKIWNSTTYKKIRYELDTENYDTMCWNCPLVQPNVTDFKALEDEIKKSDYEDIVSEFFAQKRYINRCQQEIDQLTIQKENANLFESLVLLIRKNPFYIFPFSFWFFKGKNVFKQKIYEKKKNLL